MLESVFELLTLYMWPEKLMALISFEPSGETSF